MFVLNYIHSLKILKIIVCKQERNNIYIFPYDVEDII